MSHRRQALFTGLEQAPPGMRPLSTGAGARICWAARALAGATLVAIAAGAAMSAPVADRTVQLNKVIIDTDTNPIHGQLKSGTLCLPSPRGSIIERIRASRSSHYDTLFSEQMKARGFSIVSTTTDLFPAEHDKDPADLLIGAIIRPDRIDLCSSVLGQKGVVRLAIEWQIYDRAAGKVVDTETVTGEGLQDRFVRDGYDAMWSRAFVASLDALVGTGIVARYAKRAEH